MDTVKKKPVVLVVDDQKTFLDAVVDELNFLDFDTISAQDGQEAFDRSNKTKFDLIISDIRMPNKDGKWFLTELRKIQKTSPPFIFMTGFADLSIQDAYAMGVDGFLGKPLNPKKLDSLLEKLILPIDTRWSKAINETVVHHIDKSFSCSALDKNLKEILLGRGGIYISIPKLAFEVDDLISFKLQFSDGIIKCLEGVGRVVWKKENPEGISDEYGLYFEYLTSATLSNWLSYLKSKDIIAVIPNGQTSEEQK